MNLPELGTFLSLRRGRVRPADVGLPAGTRRRVPGLRRDEVARLADISVDYYIELEQGRGQTPSFPVLTSLARALRLNADETAHLYHLAGYQVPLGADPVPMRQALIRLLDRLDHLPAMLLTDLGDVRFQNRLSLALVGPRTATRSAESNFVYQWFARTGGVRELYPAEDHPRQSRMLVADLRAAVARRGSEAAAAALVARLRATGEEFTGLWDAQEVAVRRAGAERIVHPELGLVGVTWESFYTADAHQRVLWMVPEEAEVIDRLRGLDVERVWGPAAPEPGVSGTLVPDPACP